MLMDEDDKIHIKFLIQWLIAEVLSACGDGDSVWLLKHYTLEQIIPLIKEKMPSWWEISFYDNHTVNFGREQEWLTVTTDKEMFNKLPEWYQCKIIY